MKLRLRLGLVTLAVALPLMAAFIWVNFYAQERAAVDVIASFTLSQMQAGEREHCESTPERWMGRRRPHGGPGRPPPPRDDFDPKPPPPPPDPLFRDEPPWDRPGGPPPPRHRRPGGPRPGGPFAPPRGPPRGGPPGGPPMRAPELYAYDAALVSRNPEAPPLDETLRAAMREGRQMALRRLEEDGHRVQDILLRMSWQEGPCAFVLARRMDPPWPPGPGRGGLGLNALPLRIWLVPTGVVLLAMIIALGPVVQRLRRLGAEVRAAARVEYRHAITVEGSDEIADLARAFADAGQEIRAQIAAREQREQALRSFLENTTHDVMIPLTVLKGHLALLGKQAGRGEPVPSATVTAAMQEAHYMASLIHNLAVAARLEAGAPELAMAPVALGELVGRAVSRHLPIARQKQVSLDAAVPEEPVRVEGDVTLIEQAVSNVIYNAIRYNHPGGHVAVILDVLEQGARFRLRVLDDGPGIPESERARLIERRFRGNQARTRDPGGHGLGLNIAYHVATLHGFELVLGPSEFAGLQVDFLGPLQTGPLPSRE